MSKIQKQFGNIVRALRLSMGLSQEKIAFIVIIYLNYIGGIERGERNSSLKNIIAIANT